jgi:hypothetical protein
MKSIKKWMNSVVEYAVTRLKILIREQHLMKPHGQDNSLQFVGNVAVMAL